VATTIARLAAVLTAESGQFDSVMDRSRDKVAQFKSVGDGGVLKSGLQNSLFGAASAFKTAGDASKVFHGHLGKLGGVAAALGTSGGGLVLAAAGAALLAAKLIGAADAEAEARNRIREDFGKAFEEANGKKASLELEPTVTSSWKDTKAAISETFAVLGENTGLFSGTVGLFKNVSQTIKAIADDMKTPAQRARDQQMEWMKQQTVKLQELAKQKEEQKKVEEKAAADRKRIAEEAEREMQRRMDETMRHAERLHEALRTPDEIYKDTIAELKDLAAQSLLTSEDVARGTAKAQSDLDNATKNKERILRAQDTSVGAAERFTMAGFSAVQQGREQARLEANQKKHIEVAKEQSGLLKGIDARLANAKPVVFQMSNL
jgi:hypothetical protein